jgi:hypothetical protein
MALKPSRFVWCLLHFTPSAPKALVRLAVVDQVADPVGAVFEDRCGGEDQDAELWIHEWDDVQSGHQPGELADVAEVFECFHAPGQPCQRVPCPAAASPVALDVDPLEPEVAHDRVDGLELDARAEEGVGGRQVRGGFPAGGQVVGQVVDPPGDHVAGGRAEDVGVVDLARDER